MVKNIGKISNPLTIIAIFAGLAEINGTVVLSIVPTNIQATFLWFIILFPSILVLLFFITLNFNPNVIYAPSDFSNEENFLKTIGTSASKFEEVKVEITNANYKSSDSLVKKVEDLTFNKTTFAPEGRRHLEKANSFFKLFSESLRSQFEKGIIKSLSFGIQAPEYFLLSYSFPKEKSKQSGLDYSDCVIIRVTEDSNGELALIAIGKDIIETDIHQFTDKLLQYVQRIAKKVIDNKML